MILGSVSKLQQIMGRLSPKAVKPGELLDMIGEKYGDIWNMSPASFLSAYESGSIPNLAKNTTDSSFVSSVLSDARNVQKHVPSLKKPGLQEWSQRLRGGAQVRYMMYNDAAGNPIVGSSIMRMNKKDNWILSNIAADPAIAASARREAVNTVARKRMSYGAVELSSASKGGALLLHRISRMIHSDVNRSSKLAQRMVTGYTVPSLASSPKRGGSRKMPVGRT